MTLVGERPAVVFWSCTAGDTALFWHLRRLNMVRVPVWVAEGKAEPESGVTTDSRFQSVLLRHWDPRVLGALLPVLDAAQFGRIMGPAAEICYFAADFGGVKRVLADPEWPIAPRGQLTITGEQVAAMTERRVEARRRRAMAYLRSVTGRDLEGVSDAAVYRHVRVTESSAERLGIMTEAGQCRWTYLTYATRGQVERQEDLLVEMQSGRQSPDETVERAMAAALDYLGSLRRGART